MLFLCHVFEFEHCTKEVRSRDTKKLIGDVYRQMKFEVDSRTTMVTVKTAIKFVGVAVCWKRLWLTRAFCYSLTGIRKG